MTTASLPTLFPSTSCLSEQTLRAHVADSLQRTAGYADPAVWIHRAAPDDVFAQLERALQKRRDGADLPLLGMTVAVKDNIDVAGMPTTAACPAFSRTPDESAFAVQKLQEAGAVILGKTNLDQFATGLVGTRSPYGACRNVFDPAYISGGSSSGSAVAVAAGLVDFSLGTDTAGSGRVPASFNQIIGMKPSRGLVSIRGVIPACRSLDCVSIFTRDCTLAARVLGVICGHDPRDLFSRASEDFPEVGSIDALADVQFRFGVPADHQLEFFGNSDAEWLYRRALARARAIGGKSVTIDLDPFLETARLLYEGPWVAERYLVVKDLIERSPESLLPVTRQIIEGARRFSAADVFSAQYRLAELSRRCKVEWEKMDTLLLPTTGTIYRRDEVEADPVRLNQNLGYYTNFVNLLDLSAVAIPNGFQVNGLPAGVTFMAPSGWDWWLLSLASRYDGANRPPLEGHA